MLQEKQILNLLQVVVPAATPLTTVSEIKILEILGIVTNPELVKAMDFAASMIPAATPATISGLLQLIGGLISINPNAKKAHHDALAQLSKSLQGQPDAVLTFGSFLTICQAMMQSAATASKTGK